MEIITITFYAVIVLVSLYVFVRAALSFFDYCDYLEDCKEEYEHDPMTWRQWRAAKRAYNALDDKPWR